MIPIKILVASTFPEKILSTLRKYDDEFIFYDDSKGKIDLNFIKSRNINYVISFGYKYIFPRSAIEYCPIINLHNSYLPWNRGPNPNLWSWLNNTPKGVTIHYIDAGIDTGDIIAQKELNCLSDEMTLNETFWATRQGLAELFEETWPLIREGKNQRYPQLGKGSLHTFQDQAPFQDILENGLNTPMRELCETIRERVKSIENN